LKRRPAFLEGFAEREAAWFFRVLGGKLPVDGDPTTREAAEQIDRWLAAIPPFHRGVLQLRYVPRSWPTDIVDELGELTSVVVRLECALHPAVGLSNEALEHASVERLRQSMERCERVRARRVACARERPLTPAERVLQRLGRRAHQHVQLAIRALARVRRDSSCVVPEAGAR